MAAVSRILVADDNHDAADTLAQLLGLMGYDTVAVYDGEQAVQACRVFNPALAILDVQMPLLDGCAAAQRIRQAEGPPPRLASLTALQQHEEPLRSSGELFDSHLRKPPRFDELSALLDRLDLRPH